MSVVEYDNMPIQTIRQFEILNRASTEKLLHKRKMNETGNTGKTFAFD